MLCALGLPILNTTYRKKYLLYCKTASMLGLNELNCFGDGIKDKMTTILTSNNCCLGKIQLIVLFESKPLMTGDCNKSFAAHC